MVDLPGAVLLAIPLDAELPIALGPQDALQRHLEHRMHLTRIGHKGPARLNHRHHRRDQIIGAGEIGLHEPHHPRIAARHAHFLIGFAQRGGSDIIIASINLATGKRHLPRMRPQVWRALGIQHGEPLGAPHQRNQHRRGNRRTLKGPRRRPVRRQHMRSRQRGRRQQQARRQAVDNGIVGGQANTGYVVEKASLKHQPLAGPHCLTCWSTLLAAELSPR